MPFEIVGRPPTFQDGPQKQNPHGLKKQQIYTTCSNMTNPLPLPRALLPLPHAAPPCSPASTSDRVCCIPELEVWGEWESWGRCADGGKRRRGFFWGGVACYADVVRINGDGVPGTSKGEFGVQGYRRCGLGYELVEISISSVKGLGTYRSPLFYHLLSFQTSVHAAMLCFHRKSYQTLKLEL